MTRHEKVLRDNERLLETEHRIVSAHLELGMASVMLPENIRVSFGETGMHWLRAKGRRDILHFVVPYLWLESVYARGLSMVKSNHRGIVLEAIEAEFRDAHVDSAWNLTIAPYRGLKEGHLANISAVIYAGVLFTGTSLTNAHKHAVAAFHFALTGEPELPF